jgi:hypothetical protein
VANNRITYATAQVSIKDNRRRATNAIDKWYPELTLASGISASDTVIQFNETVSGVWPNVPLQFRLVSGGATEYVYASQFLADDTVAVVRGDGETTARSHSSGNQANLNGWEVPLGMQTASVSTAFNTEDVFHIGQLDAYENVETLPEIEVTLERVLDGTKPLWLMVTDPDQTTLKGRTADYQVDVAISVYPDVQDSATGTPDSVMTGSGMYVSAISYNFVAEGNWTESVTLIGNDKTWTQSEGVPSGYFPTSDAFDATVVGSGVQRSEDFDRAGSTLPTDISADDRIQSITVSADIGREEIYELGQKRPFFRAVTFPLTVTTTFETITSEGDKVEALSTVDNLTNQQITLVTDAGLTINLGAKNKLASVEFAGFDAGGGNGTATFEYTNSNSLTITHPATDQAKNP